MPGRTPSTPPSAHDGASSAGRGQVERRGRAEAAGADQQDLRLEQLQLARLSDLRDQQVARVPRSLLGREGRRQDDLVAVPLPVGEAAGEGGDVLVAELLQR